MAPVPAGFAPVQFPNYDLEAGPSFNLAQAEGEEESDWAFLRMLGLNM